MSNSFVTPWIVARQAPLSMGYSRQEYWSGLPFPSSGDLPDPGIEPVYPALAGGFFTTESPGKPQVNPFTSVQSCLTLCDPMDCSPPGSSVHGILEARILEWVAISFSNKLEQLFFCNDCEVNPGRKMLQLKWKKIMDLKLSDGG